MKKVILLFAMLFISINCFSQTKDSTVTIENQQFKVNKQYIEALIDTINNLTDIMEFDYFMANSMKKHAKINIDSIQSAVLLEAIETQKLLINNLSDILNQIGDYKIDTRYSKLLNSKRKELMDLSKVTIIRRMYNYFD